eukprot:356274-Chlamydomonas_euryale.AAC.11
MTPFRLFIPYAPPPFCDAQQLPAAAAAGGLRSSASCLLTSLLCLDLQNRHRCTSISQKNRRSPAMAVQQLDDALLRGSSSCRPKVERKSLAPRVVKEPHSTAVPLLLGGGSAALRSRRRGRILRRGLVARHVSQRRRCEFAQQIHGWVQAHETAINTHVWDTCVEHTCGMACENRMWGRYRWLREGMGPHPGASSWSCRLGTKGGAVRSMCALFPSLTERYHASAGMALAAVSTLK